MSPGFLLPPPFLVGFVFQDTTNSPWRWCGVKCAALFPLSNPFLQTSCQESAPVLIHSLGSSSSRGPRCSRAVFVAVTLSRTSTFKATPQCPFLLGPQRPQGFCLSAKALVQCELKGQGSFSLPADPLGLLQESPSSFKRVGGPKDLHCPVSAFCKSCC